MQWSDVHRIQPNCHLFCSYAGAPPISPGAGPTLNQVRATYFTQFSVGNALRFVKSVGSPSRVTVGQTRAFPAWSGICIPSPSRKFGKNVSPPPCAEMSFNCSMTVTKRWPLSQRLVSSAGRRSLRALWGASPWRYRINLTASTCANGAWKESATHCRNAVAAGFDLWEGDANRAVQGKPSMAAPASWPVPPFRADGRHRSLLLARSTRACKWSCHGPTSPQRGSQLGSF